ncbi:MAG: hypothetical protein DMF72_20290 [Acidobacteria bacterium]|nr:MAG: hypothetical protein DMF72_20290 [Acidobacteriota bacterium]
MNLQNNQIADFSPSRRALFEALLQEEGLAPPAACRIPRRTSAAVTPLSFAQQRLWFLEQLDPGGSAYNIPWTIRLTGKLELDGLKQSLRTIIARHETLRTNFALIAGEPSQVIAQSRAVLLPVVDLRELSEQERGTRLRNLTRDEAQKPFDLESGPLLRTTLLRLSDLDQVLLLTIHHIISDGWSAGVLLNEIGSLYTAYVANLPTPLEELPIQYADYTLWQREAAQSEVLELQLAYWKQQLRNAPAALDLPRDYPRPHVPSFRGAREPLSVSAESAEALQSLSQSEGVTMFMTLLAAFQTLLHRYSGQDDIVVGSPIANRTQAETSKLIGCFANTLALRTDLSSNPTFRELLKDVREVVLGAYAHQEIPFERLVEQLQAARSLSQTPFFQAAFVLQNAPRAELELPGLRMSAMRVDSERAKFDLTLSLWEEFAGLSGTMEYRTDLFEAATIRRMVGHFTTLLEAIAANPDQGITELPLLTEAEQRRLLVERRDARAVYPADSCLHHLFEVQVERTPEALALTCEGQQLTYQELNARANQLAHFLRQRGVGPDVLVGLFAERSIEMMVGMLGILKAGGAYLPLDIRHPVERLTLMLEDAQVEVVLTQAVLRDLLPTPATKVVFLDTDWPLIAQQSTANPPATAGPENLAYVIYTSGSTGRPKGVLTQHDNVMRLLSATHAWFNFDVQDVWTMFHSYAFDFSVWEVWGALLSGGRLVIVPYLVSRSPDDFYQLLAREQVTVLNQTPSAFRQLMLVDEQEERAEELALRLVIFGGEALEVQSLGSWFKRHGDERPQMVNMYGITETTVHVTYRTLSQADVDQSVGSVIGNAIPDLQLHVLDRHMRLMPVGLAGEMYVGGAGLARGYMNRPELTAQRFLPDPFSGKRGARLYQTGDLGRYTVGEGMKYLGRADRQVKIRGFRVELGEIEAALNRHPAISQSLVLMREAELGEQRLVAHVVAAWQEAGAPSVSELRSYLKDQLPEYMVPQAFVLLNEMPLTGNGKIDQRSLPAPDLNRREVQQEYVRPQTVKERVLAGAWAEVLGVHQVGVNDNFFDLGGDSMLSVKVTALARKKGLNVSLQKLFQYQTIARLAIEIDEPALDSVPTPKTEPFSLITTEDYQKLPADVEDAYPLAQMQAGMLYHMAYLPDQMVYHNVYSYQVRARFDLPAIQKSFQRAVDQHPILRTSFDLTSYSEPLQLVHRKVFSSITVEDLRHLSFSEQEKKMDALIESEKRQRFDLSRPPLLRLYIHRRRSETLNFTLSECHPIFDGWSLHSLIAEICADYFSLLAKEPLPPRPSLSNSYADFVGLERAALKSEESKKYWHDKLIDCTVMELPRRPSLRHSDVPRIHKLNSLLSIELSAALKGLARNAGVSLKSVLLAAHLKVMSIMSGQTDILTGLVSGGRPEETDGDSILGLFLNTLPFRLDLSDETWTELIQKTFKAEVELLPFRRYPIAALQQQWGRKPLFETIFNYLHFHVLDDLFRSGNVEVIDGTRLWEETNLTLSTAFIIPPLSSQILMTLRFDTTQFGAEHISAIHGYYERVLNQVVTAPYELHNLKCFLSGEEQQLLANWNDTQQNHPAQKFVHRLFEEQAAKTPNNIAVVYEDDQIAYGELNRQANRLAHHLQALAVKPEVTVGICLERSVEMLVSILGIMKAGGAYVPLDPDSPGERTAMILEQADVQVLLTQQSLVDELAGFKGCIVCIDTDRNLIAEESDENIESPVMDENLAYVLFTSGSTARPKGVAIEHRQLSNYLSGIIEILGLPGGASYAMVSTFATDLGNTVIFPSLCTGGCLHVISQKRVSDAQALADYFERHPIDCLKIVPSHLGALLSSAQARNFLPRQRLILGGEPSDWKLIETVHKLAPECVVINHYGPTETTVGVVTGRIEKNADYDSTTVPLGRPLSNTQIHVLDAHLHAVPIATMGELHIAGTNLARGYLHRPDLTAETFVPNPLSDEPGARLYRSGDLARYLPNGSLEFLGRRDGQVKLRGHRIELGEIESVLTQHPAVRAAVAMVREDHPGNKKLVAYVVLNEAAATSDELRRYLREKLPEYMAPSNLLLLDELPLTSNGKVNRAALPHPDGRQSESQSSYVGPQSETERVIAAIWQEALQIEGVCVHDNFLDLGGHSLVLLQIQSRLRGILNRDISIVELFEHPTIHSLAAHLSGGMDQQLNFQQIDEAGIVQRDLLSRRRQVNRTLLTNTSLGDSEHEQF